MIDAYQQQLLRAFVEGRTTGRDTADFETERAAARRTFPVFAAMIEGKDLSLALRRAGFNRDYDAPASTITYRRKAA